VRSFDLEQLTHQLHGCSLVAPSLHKQVETLAFVVNRAPQPNRRPAIITSISSRSYATWAEGVDG
jgi:hypothetical protein